MRTYRELPPPADLLGHLRCTWTAVTGPPATVLPDGCLDLMWLGGELVVAGPDTGPVPTRLPPGTEIAAVRFRPGAAPAVLGLPAAELRDRRVPLADLWAAGAQLSRRLDGAAGAAERVALLAAAVRARLADAPPVDPVALAVAGALAAVRPAGGGASGSGSRAPAGGPDGGGGGGGSPAPAGPADSPGGGAGGNGSRAPAGGTTGGTTRRPVSRPASRRAGEATGGSGTRPPGVRAAVVAGWVGARQTGGPAIRPLQRGAAGVVAVLAAQAGLSERQLHRRCLTAFGYGPKMLDRVLRLQHFLALGRARPAASLAELAAAAGYADQAHLGHECRALGGATPGELRPVSDPDKTW